MPLTYDADLYDALYNIGLSDGERHGYERAVYEEAPDNWKKRIQMLPQGILQNASVLVVGCGFGWLIEELKSAGLEEVYGVDPSPYIQNNKADHAAPDTAIWDAIVGVDDINQISKNQGGPRHFDFVVDEDACSSQSDSELEDFFQGCRDALRGNDHSRIVHLMTPKTERGGQDSAINWKFMSEWKALAPEHTWIDLHTGEVV